MSEIESNTHRDPQIRVVMLPKDTNFLGNIFGGVILAHLDLAASEHARRLAPGVKFVTKVMKEVDFIAPVKVGDTVSFYTNTVRIGKTSVSVKVLVEVERSKRLDSSITTQSQVERIKVTEAEVVMVAVDADGKATPIQ